MLIQFFRKSFAVQYILTGVAGVILWAPSWVNPTLVPAPSGPVPLYELLYHITGSHPLISSVLGFIVVLVSAYVLNRMFTIQELVPKNSSITGFLFILMMSGNPANQTLTQVNIALLCLIYVVHCLLSAYSRKDPVDLAFTAGFFISFSSLFYIPSILLYGFLLTGFFVYRSLNWREWIASLIGLVTPLIFVFTYHFVFDTLEPTYNLYRAFVIPRPISLAGVTPLFLFITGVFLLFIFSAFARSVAHLAERTVEIRKKNIVLYWLLFWMAVSLPWSAGCVTIHPSLAFMAVVPFVANFLLTLKKPFWWEILIWILLLAILFQSYLILF